MPNYFYGCVPSLAWILGHYFYGRKHFVWLAAEYFPYRLANPKSSNPHLLYQDLYQPWKDNDNFDRNVVQLRLNLRKGILAQHKAGTIATPEAIRLKNVCDKVNIVFFYPVVYRVDMSLIVPSRRKVAGSGVTAGSSEYLVTDLAENEFDILFLDYTADTDFVQLVVNEHDGSSSTSLTNALTTLEGRC
jgi:hypothetical protein